MARKAGTKNRNYPPVTLAMALKVPRAIQDQASGMSVSRLTLAELLDSTPTSRVLKELVASSRFYGLTEGGINSDQFSLTELGEQATGGDEVKTAAALKGAVMNIPPYKAFFDSFANKKMPGATPLREFLTRDAEVPSDKAEECARYIADDAATAGLSRNVKNGTYIDLEGIPAQLTEEDLAAEAQEEDIELEGANDGREQPNPPGPELPNLDLPFSPRRV
jgi:hypothetical protein